MLFSEMLAIQPVPQLYQIVSGEETLDFIIQQEAAIRDIRGRILPPDLFPAAKGPGMIQNSVGAVRPRSARTSGGQEETTVIDYTNRSIIAMSAGEARTYGAATGARTVTFSFRAAASYQPGQIGETADRLRAAYGEERSLLAKHHSGGDLKAETEKLDKFYGLSQQALADFFAEMTGGFFEKYGHRGQAEKIIRSVLALFADEPVKDCYTLAELDFTAAGAAAYRAAVNGVCYGSEIWQAVRLSMADMKVERMALHSGDGGVTDVFRAVRENIHRDFLDTMDAYITKRREEGEVSPPLDQDMFRAAYDAILHEFRMSGNALAAVHTAAEMAPELLGRAVEETPAPRWTRELEADGLWDSFDRPVYLCGMFASLEEDWQNFIDHFIARRELHGQG